MPAMRPSDRRLVCWERCGAEARQRCLHRGPSQRERGRHQDAADETETAWTSSLRPNHTCWWRHGSGGSRTAGGRFALGGQDGITRLPAPSTWSGLARRNGVGQLHLRAERHDHLWPHHGRSVWLLLGKRQQWRTRRAGVRSRAPRPVQVRSIPARCQWRHRGPCSAPGGSTRASAVTTDGTAYCWGSDANEQLGAWTARQRQSGQAPAR